MSFRCPGLTCWLMMIMAASVVAAQGPASVAVDEVRMETNIVPVREHVGTVHPARRTLIGSAVDGRVSEFKVEAGQAVEEREEIAQILTGTIDIEIKVAEAERDARKAELDELRAGSRPEEIARAEAQLAAAEALDVYARSRLQRAMRLAGSAGVISAEELELARSQQQSAAEAKNEAEQTLALMKAGTRAERLAQAEALLAVAEETVHLLNDRLKKYTLRSPFKGYVVREYTEVGAWVKSGDPVAEVVEIRNVDVEINVPERIVPFLRTGMQVPVSLEALPGEEFTGEITRIIPEADTRARTFPVRVTVANETEDEAKLIRPGMLARAALPAGNPASGLTVPKDAVVLGGPRPVVYKNQQGVAQMVPVTILVESFDRYLIEGDLQEGDQVVVRGNERLRQGSEIRVLTSKTP